MTNQHWRELVEIVGVVAIVAGLILVASELRQSNRIAAAQAEQQISENFNALNKARATDSEFAKLFPKLEDPDSHLITATDASQIRGIAMHLSDAQWAVHRAYKKELISRQVLESYISDFAYTLERWPGIRSDLVDMYQNHDWMRQSAVYRPIAEYITDETGENPESTGE